jgi:hypothetical protein
MFDGLMAVPVTWCTLRLMAFRCAIIRRHIITAEDSYATTQLCPGSKNFTSESLGVISGGNPQLDLYLAILTAKSRPR